MEKVYRDFQAKKDTPKRQYMWDFLLLLNKTIQKLIPMSYTYYRLPTQFRDNFFGFELQNCQEIVLQQGLLMLQGRNFDGPKGPF